MVDAPVDEEGSDGVRGEFGAAIGSEGVGDPEGGECLSERLSKARRSISGSGDHRPVGEPVHQDEVGDPLVVEEISAYVLERVEGFQGRDGWHGGLRWCVAVAHGASASGGCDVLGYSWPE